MTLTLYYHPLASFCHKVQVALHEAALPFRPRVVDLGNAADRAELAALWPLAKFPVLKDEARGVVLPESSIIIEHLATHFPAAAGLLPADPALRLQVRLLDRIADSYLQEPMQKIVGDRLRPEAERDARGVADARALLVSTYRLLEGRLADAGWLAGPGFTLADCAAAPALFYATTLEPLPPDCPRLGCYFDRLMARPSVQRVLEEARPWFRYYPYADAIPARFLSGS